MSSSDQLFERYHGQLVPSTANAGFIALSYVVSLIGAASTLELMFRRTSRNGLSNHVLLLSSAVTMGGISIWCMHFIGNRAIILGNGEQQLQIVYSSGFTALSFFIPILVLLAAFIAVGTNDKVSWWRIGGGGFLAGAAICGMHYLGNASIENYTCIYTLVNVIGAALIAVAASTVALALFFVMRASWTNVWWKRISCAIVMAGAVSGMHWCAATGTQYRLVHLSEGGNNSTTLIIVVVLSVVAASIMVGTAFYTSNIMRRYALKAQQVVLASAIFDQKGRILVSPDGLLPSEKITDTYIERTHNDVFSVAHPLFHWMFQASRNWSGLSPVINNMANHLAQLPKAGRDNKICLIDDDGQLIQNYDIIFRELFCLAAVNLAEKMKEHISNVGILWDEILPTGAGGIGRRSRLPLLGETTDAHGSAPARKMGGGLAEKGEGWKLRQADFGRGSLMFLVRRLDTTRDMERFEAAGYRFAEVNQVCGIIGSSMQIKTRALGSKLQNMANYAVDNILEPGVHIGFFGIRAQLGGAGFEVLVRKAARNLFPSLQMPLERLADWQIEYIKQLDQLSVPMLCDKLDSMKRLSPREMLFASQLADTIEALRAWIDDPIFDSAALTSRLVQIPCRSRNSSGGAATCTMITITMVIPIHTTVQSPKCEFIPLNFFKVHQMVYRDSPQHAAFSRLVHRELAPLVNTAAQTPADQVTEGRRSSVTFTQSRLEDMKKLFGNGGARTSNGGNNDGDLDTVDRKSSTGSAQTGSTLKLWNPAQSEVSKSRPISDPSGAARLDFPAACQFGGIMVSQEIKVDVLDTDDDGLAMSADPSTEQNKPYKGPRTIVTAKSRSPLPYGQSMELGSMPEIEHGVHFGPQTGSAVVQSERLAEVATFVDELFSVCKTMNILNSLGVVG